MMSIIRKPVLKNSMNLLYIHSFSQIINVANLQTFGGLLRQANGSVMKAPLSRLSFTQIRNSFNLGLSGTTAPSSFKCSKEVATRMLINSRT